MTDDQKVVLELLKLKQILMKKMNDGNFVIHPRDVIDQINEILKKIEE